MDTESLRRYILRLLFTYRKRIVFTATSAMKTMRSTSVLTCLLPRLFIANSLMSNYSVLFSYVGFGNTIKN